MNNLFFCFIISSVIIIPSFHFFPKFYHRGNEIIEMLAL